MYAYMRWRCARTGFVWMFLCVHVYIFTHSSMLHIYINDVLYIEKTSLISIMVPVDVKHRLSVCLSLSRDSL